MNTAVLSGHDVEAELSVDAVEEIRLRTWARKHYAPAEDRSDEWHPVILDEMFRMDHEA